MSPVSLCLTRYLLAAFFEYYSCGLELTTSRTVRILNGFAVIRLHDERLFYGLEKGFLFVSGGSLQEMCFLSAWFKVAVLVL
jgi:hypothetical protein